jgi:hypothetical protein
MKYRFKIILISVILYSSCKPQKILYLTLPDNHPQKLFLYTDYSEYKPLKTDKKGNFYPAPNFNLQICSILKFLV